MGAPPHRLDTERLILRPASVDDAPAIFEAYARDPEVTRYLIWRPHETIDDTRTFLRSCEAAWESGSAYAWVLALRSNERVIGMIDLRPQTHHAEIGYVLARPYWRHGYMSEALRAVVTCALAQPEVYRVWAVCDVDNAASARLLEGVGFRYEGILRRWSVHPNASEEPRDCLCYAVTK